MLLNAVGRIEDSSEEYYIGAYQLELRERNIRKLSWEQHVNLLEPLFLIPIQVNRSALDEQDAFSCLVLGRNAIALYREHAVPQEVESALLEVMIHVRFLCSTHPRRRQPPSTDTAPSTITIAVTSSRIRTGDSMPSPSSLIHHRWRYPCR